MANQDSKGNDSKNKESVFDAMLPPKDESKGNVSGGDAPKEKKESIRLTIPKVKPGKVGKLSSFAPKPPPASSKRGSQKARKERGASTGGEQKEAEKKLSDSKKPAGKKAGFSLFSGSKAKKGEEKEEKKDEEKEEKKDEKKGNEEKSVEKKSSSSVSSQKEVKGAKDAKGAKAGQPEVKKKEEQEPQRADQAGEKAKPPIKRHKIEKVKLETKKRRKPKVKLPEQEPQRVVGEKIPDGVKAVAVLFLLTVMGVLAWLGYYYTLETGVRVTVDAGDLELYPEASVITEFGLRERVAIIQRDYDKRLNPLEERFRLAEEDLVAAKSSLAGIEERQKLLLDAIRKDEEAIPKILEDSRERLSHLWEEEGDALESEFKKKLEALFSGIQKRAAQNELEYQGDFDVRAPEVAVNAYRIALYGASDRLNVDEERMWVENLLKEWREYQKEWKVRQDEIRDKALSFKKIPGPKIDRATRRIEDLRKQVKALEPDMGLFSKEVEHRQKIVDDLKVKIKALDKPFREVLTELYEEYELRTFPISANGVIDLRAGEDEEPLRDGRNQLLIRGRRGGEEFWAFKDVEVVTRKERSAEVLPDDFVSVDGFMK